MHPILYQHGVVTIRSYSVAVIVGFLLGLRYTLGAARRRMAGRPADAPGAILPDDVFDACLVGLVAGIIGTRVLYVIANPAEFRGHWLQAFAIWQGGLSFIGAPVFGFGYAWWFARRRGLPFLALADLGAPAFALASAVGRVGCFFNGCCYGSACSAPWAVQFPMERHPGMLTPPSHPAQLYEAVMQLVVFGALDRWLRGKHRDGEVLVGYMALYCIIRTISEQFRKGATADIFVWGLTHAQFFCLAALPVFLLLLWRIRRSPAEVTAPPTPAEPTTPVEV